MKLLSALMICAMLGGFASPGPAASLPPATPGGNDVGFPAATASPAGPPHSPVSVRQAIAIALANNPEVAARGWEVTAARARQEQANGARLPRLGVAGAFFHYLDDQRLIAASRDGEPGLFSRDLAAADLVLTLPLYTGGRLVSQVKAAELFYDAAGQRLVRSREELVFNVTSVFFNILAQRQVIESLAVSRQALVEHLKRIEALLAEHKAARVDRMRVEVRLADVEQQLVREKNLLAIQHGVLTILLGGEGDGEEISPQGELTTPENVAFPELETAVAGALKERGDYLAARSSLAAQARNVDAARAALRPSVSLQGAYGERWAAGAANGTAAEAGDAGRLGLVLEMPIFEGGQAAARISEQRAGLAVSRERLRALENQIRLEVQTALLNMESSGERVAAIRKAIDQARESLRIERLKYELGEGTVADVLDAQAALLQTETNYYRTLADLRTAGAQLDLATGRTTLQRTVTEEETGQ